MGFYAEFDAILESCSERTFVTDSDHIDFHKPELYAMLSLLVNETARTALEMRSERGELGLIGTGNRCVNKLPSNVGMAMLRTLSQDASTTADTYREVVVELSPFLAHMNKFDKTSHKFTGHMISGGLQTMITQFDSLYEDIQQGLVQPLEADQATYWRILLDQSKLGIAEIISLDHPNQAHDEFYMTASDGTARFCAHAIKLTDGAKSIPKRDTIGCPISFEPALLRDLWQWYVDLRTLRRSQTQSKLATVVTASSLS